MLTSVACQPYCEGSEWPMVTFVVSQPSKGNTLKEDLLRFDLDTPSLS